MTHKPWDGRFAEETDQAVEAFTSSIATDRRLYREDINGSIAHCRMLARTGIIAGEEARQLVNGLEQIRSEIENDRFVYDDRLEDIHMHVESRLAEIRGRRGAQAAYRPQPQRPGGLGCPAFIWGRKPGASFTSCTALRQVVVDAAEANFGTIMPGYTHMQRAQPVLPLPNHLMAYYEMFTSRQRPVPQRAGAHRGQPAGIGPRWRAPPLPSIAPIRPAQLGMPRVAANSMDAVADRDFMLEVMGRGQHRHGAFQPLVGRVGAVGHQRIQFHRTTGCLCHRKQHHAPEEKPGCAGIDPGQSRARVRRPGGLVDHHERACPLAYNRDMQEDKAPLFSTVDTLQGCITIMTAMLPRVTFKKEVMRQATRSGFLNATDMGRLSRGQRPPFSAKPMPLWGAPWPTLSPGAKSWNS